MAAVGNGTRLVEFRGHSLSPSGPGDAGIAEGDLNTDAAVCGGSNVGSAGAVDARPVPWRGQEASMEITIPPLATIWFVSDEAARTTRIRQR